MRCTKFTGIPVIRMLYIAQCLH